MKNTYHTNIMSSSSPFSPELLKEFLPVNKSYAQETLDKIQLPDSRYDEIHDAILQMYKDSDARIMPLSVFDIAANLQYPLMTYRFLGKEMNDLLMKISKDAITIQFLLSSNPMIFYNDRMPKYRINFTIMHEIGHIILGHKEQSDLAEFEANHFAAVSLCPTVLLKHYKISNPQQVVETFKISYECAQYRMNALCNSGMIRHSIRENVFNEFVLNRFSLKNPIQLDLFNNAYAN